MGSIGASSKLGLLVKKKPGGGLVKPGGTGNSAKEESSKTEEIPSKPAGPSGLGLLGAYSDSDNSSE